MHERTELASVFCQAGFDVLMCPYHDLPSVGANRGHYRYLCCLECEGGLGLEGRVTDDPGVGAGGLACHACQVAHPIVDNRGVAVI